MDPKIKYAVTALTFGKLIKEEILINSLKQGKKPLFRSVKKIKTFLKELVDTHEMIQMEVKKTGQTFITSEGVTNENFFFGPPKGIYYLTNTKESVGRINEFLNLSMFCIFK